MTPARTCFACRGKAPKRELVRVVSFPGHGLRVDWRQKIPGRGYYLHPSKDCFQKGLKNSTISKVLGKDLSVDFSAVIDHWKEVVRDRIRNLIGQAIRKRAATGSKQVLATWLKMGKVVFRYCTLDFDPGRWEDSRLSGKVDEMNHLPLDADQLGSLLGKEKAFWIGLSDPGLAGAVSRELETAALIGVIEQGE